MMRPCPQHNVGFSLVEMAIVLGVIGVLIGGMWSLINMGIEYQHEEQAKEEMTAVVKGVRSVYMGTTFITDDERALMTKLILQGSISRQMVRSDQSTCNVNTTCVDTPWGAGQYAGGAAVPQDPFGTFRVFPWVLSWTSCPAGPGCIVPGSGNIYFALSLRNLNQQACQAMIRYASSSLGPEGLVDVIVNQVSMYNAGQFKQPVPPSIANTYCLPTAGNTQSFVNLVYKLGVSSQ